MKRPDSLAYMDFFKPDAPWKRGAARLDVFQVSTQFILSSTDEQLTTVFNDLKRRNFPVSISMGAAQREPGCGAGEGYMPEAIVDLLGKRLTKHGFKLAYMEWMSRSGLRMRSSGEENGQVPCHYPLPKLVTQVALTIKHMRRYFPDLKVGDIEVAADYADRKIDIHAVAADYVQFSRMFEKAAGPSLRSSTATSPGGQAGNLPS